MDSRRISLIAAIALILALAVGRMMCLVVLGDLERILARLLECGKLLAAHL